MAEHPLHSLHRLRSSRANFHSSTASVTAAADQPEEVAEVALPGNNSSYLYNLNSSNQQQQTASRNHSRLAEWVLHTHSSLLSSSLLYA